MMFGGISSARQHLESGALRAVALTGSQRNPAVPSVPTFSEKGLQVPADSYWGVYAPSGTPAPILEKLSSHFAKALADPAVQKRLTELGYLTIANTAADHDRQYRAMVKQWIGVIDKAGIKVD